MPAKVLKNPKLREKFKVGQTVHLPREVWTRLTSKMVNLRKVEHRVESVGDTVVNRPQKKLCRFAMTLGEGTTAHMRGIVIWEEWMLEKISVVEDKSGQTDFAERQDEAAKSEVITEDEQGR